MIGHFRAIVMLIFEKHKTEIIAYANNSAAAGLESCGLIVQDGVNTRYEPMLNVSRFPDREFEFNDREWEKWRDSAMCITHSHHGDEQPGTLTPSDIETARFWRLPIGVYHATFGVWDYWDPDEWHPHPIAIGPMQSITANDFVGWPFEYGRADCWSLVRGWYIGKLGILLKDYPRGAIDQLEDEGFAPFTESFQRFGFVEVDEGGIRDNDVLIFRMGKMREGTHCAVVIDAANGAGLHTLGPGLLSTTFAIDRWKTKLESVMRYQGCK